RPAASRHSSGIWSTASYSYARGSGRCPEGFGLFRPLLLSVSIVVVGSTLCGREPGPATPSQSKIMLYRAALHKKIRERGVLTRQRGRMSILSRLCNFGRCVKFGPQPLRQKARRAVSDGLAVDGHHRHDDAGGRGDEGLPRRLGLGQGE